MAAGLDPEADETRLRVFLMIGQVLFLRIAEAAVLRRLGRERYDAAFLDEAKDADTPERARDGRRRAGEQVMRRTACFLPLLLLAACGGDPATPTFQGYVEGDFVDVAPEVGGRIVELAVKRGDDVAAGDLLFTIDDAEAKAAVAQAEAEMARAEAQLANLQQGQRPPEIAVIEAQIAEANAALDKARRDFERQKALFERKVVSEAQLDQAREAITIAEARVTVRQASARRRRDAGAHAGDRGGRARRRCGARCASAGADPRLEIRRFRARRRPYRGHLLRGGRGRDGRRRRCCSFSPPTSAR